MPAAVRQSRGMPEDRKRAEAAFQLFVEDPAYFVQLWMDNDKWVASDEAAYLTAFAECSELHVTVEQLLMYSTIGLPTESVAAIDSAPWRNEFAQQLPDGARGIENAPITLAGLGVTVDDLAQGIRTWLGPNAVMQINEHGDYIFRSADNTLKVRFDYKYTYPHENPHANVEWRVGGRWYRSGPIYPYDVDPR